VTALKAESGALSVADPDGRWSVVDTHGAWVGDTWLSVTLVHEGERYGVISLGAPLGRRRYTEQERDTLGEVADDVSRSLGALAAVPAQGTKGTQGARPRRATPSTVERAGRVGGPRTAG